MEDLHDIFEVSVTNDQLEATLKQYKPFSEEITFEDLVAFVKECGLQYGIKEEIIKKVITKKTELPVVIAEGKRPIAGQDAYIWSILDRTLHEEEIDVDDGGEVNLRKVIEIPSVATGTVVGEKINATEEEPGISVYGERIPAKPGRDIKLRPGKNTRISKNGQEIISTIDGQVSVEAKVIHVFPVFEVNGDLDLKVGNIDFIGNVNIRGNVPSGFEVKAKGDIRVHGSVESASLYSDGSIFIQQGVVAQNSGMIEAKGQVKVAFLNQARVAAGGDIIVSKSILHSNVESDGYVFCKQGRGNIVGGTISSGKGIEVNEVGNHMSTATTLFLGISKRIVHSEKKYKQQLNEAQVDVQKLAVLLKRLTEKEKQSTLTGKEKIMKLRIHKSLVETNDKLNNAKEQLLEFHDIFENQQTAQIRIYKTIYPNTDLHFGKYRRKVISKHENVKFLIDHSEIKFEPL
ncbi:DUF342 domain-containing protein [Salipaludibacillus daqingensis]|uniref:DUF342 domain-containing protein n=1 Tax=Salipaludibacillus daqingensis TaxID=3041001 RepID=UPI0024745582|nr:FapA family protein [Salipaludibacillus daqingensis]